MVAFAAIATGNLMHNLNQIEEVSFSTTCKIRKSTGTINDTVTSTYNYNKGTLSLVVKPSKQAIFTSLRDSNPATAIDACAENLNNIGRTGLREADVSIEIGETLGRHITGYDMAPENLSSFVDQTKILSDETAVMVERLTGVKREDTGVWGSIKNWTYETGSKIVTLIDKYMPEQIVQTKSALGTMGSAFTFIIDKVEKGLGYWFNEESGYTIRGAFRVETFRDDGTSEAKTFATQYLPAVLPSDREELGNVVPYTRPQDAMAAFARACELAEEIQKCGYTYQLYYDGEPLALGNRSAAITDFQVAKGELERDYRDLTSVPKQINDGFWALPTIIRTQLKF